MSTAKIIALGLLLGFGIQFIFAWTAPSGAAPTGNVAGPITTGLVAQYKTGFLGINTAITPVYPLVVNGSGLFNGKIYGLSTVVSDPGTTHATKDYVDSKVAGGVGNISCDWGGWSCNAYTGPVGGSDCLANVYCDPVTQRVTQIGVGPK